MNSPGRGGALVIIGRAQTPWRRGDCPKNMKEARARKGNSRARLTLDPAFRDGLRGLERASHILAVGWFTPPARDRLIQTPQHLDRPIGVFAIRSPHRPNPIGISVARVLGVDASGGVIELDALDWFDGTPLLDIKPYFASVDSVPDATIDGIVPV